MPILPRARTTQRLPLRPWRSQRKMYVVIYRGALRRRIRRLVRSRVFNNARTATRNLDLPLAIGNPIATQLFLLHRRILASAWRPQRRTFCTAKTGSAKGDLIISWYFELPQGFPALGTFG